MENTKGNLIPHEVLTELRDISSMAMDYFEEKIVPSLRNSSPLVPGHQSPPQSSSHTGSLSALNASVNATLSSINNSFGEYSSGREASVTGSDACSFFPYYGDMMEGEIKSAITNLIPKQGKAHSTMACVLNH